MYIEKIIQIWKISKLCMSFVYLIYLNKFRSYDPFVFFFLFIYIFVRFDKVIWKVEETAEQNSYFYNFV